MKWFFQFVSFTSLLFLLQACNNNSKPLIQQSQHDTLLPPLIIPTDSVTTTITLLDTALKPTVVPFLLPGRDSYKHKVQGQAETIKSKPTEFNVPSVLKDDNSNLPKDHDRHLVVPAIRGISRFTNFTMANGLGLNTVMCATLDHYGNLWFGHDGAGATRYDGKTFTTFTKAQGLASNYVYGITEDKSGNLLFISAGSFVSRFDGKRFTQFGKTTPALAGNFFGFQNIINDKSGNLWFASGAGVSKFDGKSYTFYTTADGLSSNNVSAICEDRSGKLWFGTYGGGISCYDGKKFTTFTKAQGLADDNIGCITEDRSGKLWFGTVLSGVSCYDGKKFTTFTTAQGLISDSIACITEDKLGNLWFGTRTAGASRFDGKTFTTFTTAEGLSSNAIYTITTDNSGSIWFGTNGGGICRYDGDAFTSVSTAQGLAYNAIMSITEDSSGNIWFGSSRGGASCYDGKRFTTISSRQGLAGDEIRSMRTDHAGDIWFACASGGGLTKYDGKNVTHYSSKQGLPSDNIWSLMVDKDENIWAGGAGGISKFDGKSITAFEFNWLYDEIFQDRSGNIWFGSFNGGLMKYDGKSFTVFTRAQGLPDDDIRCIGEDKKGNLWIGTGFGLSRFDGKHFDNLSTTNGLDDNNVYDIIFDKEDNMYISTNIGIIELPAGITSLPVSKMHEGIKYFSIEQGYPISSPWRNSMYCDSNGIVWVGTANAWAPLIRFDPSALPKLSRLPPSLVIQQVKIDEQNICWSDLRSDSEAKSPGEDKNSILMPANITEENLTFRRTFSDEERERMRKRFGDIAFDSITSFYLLPVNLRLPHAHNSISIDFNATEVAYPNLISYQYILDGYSKEWSPVTKSTTASFGNMHEGKYTFKLKALGPNGVWSEPVTYTFSVLPPLWRTWWAYTLYVLIFLAALRVFSKWRERNLRFEKEKLEAIVERRTKQLNESIETLKSTQSQLIQSEKMASLGELTAGIAHEIQNPLNFVNNFSEVNRELIQELKNEILSYNKEEAISIANDIDNNEEKINHHGKRADSIVKGMLQHSRSSIGVKEPTDINALADEYLRLAYHGLRAKDNSFNATIKTDYDESIGNINIIPPDIGRVLLNLYNNAFYAIREKKNQYIEGYEPTVSVSTKKSAEKVEIRVKDNGMGIPQKVVDKIYQPFFTTKPTGQGTGLGLSLAYDIITKEHGGQLRVVTKEGEGAEFVIQLPGN